MHSIGIVGLPNVGKSTLFKALTKIEVNISNYPFTTIKPNVGIVSIPDERLEKISALVRPEKTIPYILEFFDIAGLVKNAHKGEGLGNQFLSEIQKVDLILEVVRAFGNKNVSHTENTLDSKRDIEILETEIMLKDLEIIERKIEKLKPKTKTGDRASEKEFQNLLPLKEALLKGDKNSLARIASMPDKDLLSTKPFLYLFNIDDKTDQKDLARKIALPEEDMLFMNAQEELEALDLSLEDKRELGLGKPCLDRIIKACYNRLNLVTFFTIKGGKEIRSWALPRGISAPKAGGFVHTDFEKKFIKAEVLSCDDFIRCQSWQNARKMGILRTEGHNYEVKDGDIIEFKIAP